MNGTYTHTRVTSTCIQFTSLSLLLATLIQFLHCKICVDREERERNGVKHGMNTLVDWFLYFQTFMTLEPPKS